MAEDQGDKTEAATPRRRQEAREEGNIARSPDLTAAVLLVGILLLLNWFGQDLVQALRTLVSEMLSGESFRDVNPEAVLSTSLRSLLLVAQAMAPFFIGVILIAIGINLAQVGLFFSGKRLQPKFSMLDPMKGVARLFKGGQGMFHLVMNLLKIGAVVALAWSAIDDRMGEIIGAQQLSFLQIFGLGAGLVYSVSMRIAVLLLVLAIIDYAYQRFRIERELRMTKQEVKEEMKRMDGDPHIKARRRQLANQMAMKRLRTDVPTADVIVTNPTHFAVALKYDAGAMSAPRVVAKGQDFMAMRIREIAVAHGIPILERAPLARALFKMVKVGDEIPEQFFSAVAEILAYVYELTGKSKQKQAV